jgi:CxC2 like cysteine cluster associated with KDZ transposases
MEEWLAHRDTYLHEMLHHNGREGVQVTYCTGTGCVNRGDFSCHDCAYCMHYCRNCLIDRHRLMPLHRIRVWERSYHISSLVLNLLQRWTGLFYEKTSLQELGLVIQLGHHGPSCPCPGPIQKDFVIVDLSGIHTIDVQFCACYNTSGGAASHIQLLRFRCFPSTITRPQSAFTFDVLNTFQLLTLQGKVSAYEFYSALQHKTDNTGISDVKVRFYWP